MTRPWIDPIGALAALALLLAVAIQPADALIGVAFGACWLSVTRRPFAMPADPAGRGL